MTLLALNGFSLLVSFRNNLLHNYYLANDVEPTKAIVTIYFAFFDGKKLKALISSVTANKSSNYTGSAFQ